MYVCFNDDEYTWLAAALMFWVLVRFYTVVESCVVSNQALDLCKSLQLEPCASNLWSSLTPDPKSTISSINKTTGLLNRYVPFSLSVFNTVHSLDYISAKHSFYIYSRYMLIHC